MKKGQYRLKTGRFTMFIVGLLLLTSTLTLMVNNVVNVEGRESPSSEEQLFADIDTAEGLESAPKTVGFNLDKYPDLSNAVFLGKSSVFFHCACEICTGQESYMGEITEVGCVAVEGVTVAVDPSVIPYGTKLYIEGLGTFIAQDTLPTTTGNTISVYIGGYQHMESRSMGIQVLNIYEIV